MSFTPRDYQKPFLAFMTNGGDRAFLVWHRRAGKNMCAWQWLYSEALINPGLYYYVFPSLKQGKKILWEGKTGKETENTKFMDLIDPDMIWPNARDGINNTDMTIKLRHPQDRTKEGSMIQIVGTKSDGGKNEADHLRGTNPRGIIMDEYGDHNPFVWETILSPILLENQGWALFTMTPKGNNHAKKMFDRISKTDRWFVQVLDVTQTTRANGKPVISEADIEYERLEGKDEAYIQQEYYVSWDGIQKGSFYTDQIVQCRKDHRIRPSLYRPELHCFTAWDIGHEDATVILIGQQQGRFVYWIDGIKEVQKDLQWAWNWLKDKRRSLGYQYGVHYMPWDFDRHEWAASGNRQEFASLMGMTDIKVVDKQAVAGGREKVRAQFANWYFDSVTMQWAVDDLSAHKAEWDEKKQTFNTNEAPSTHKHTADAFRTYATARQLPSQDIIATLPTMCDGMQHIFERSQDDYGRREGPDARDLYSRVIPGDSRSRGLRVSQSGRYQGVS